jgi:hypothetical protein
LRNSVQTLSEKNFVMLQESSGIGDVMVAASGCRTIVDEADKLQLGIALNLCRVPGLHLPLHAADSPLGPPIYRSDNPQVIENRMKSQLLTRTHSGGER